MAARGVTDPDVWWHLKTGELITETHHVPHTDPFSFTHYGQPWVNHEWLSDLLIYDLYHLAGWGGLIILFALISTATLMIAYARSPGRPYIAAAVTVLGAAASAPTWGVRPQTISLLFGSIFLWLVERSAKRASLIWWTVPLTLLWVNLHGGYALGIALMLLFAAGALLDVAFGQRRWQAAAPQLGMLALATAVCIAVVPLNPNGTRMYSYPLSTLSSPTMQNFISEWFSPDFHQHKYLPLMVLLLGTFAGICFSDRRFRPRDILLLLVTLAGALHSVRHIPIFVLVAIPVLSGAIHRGRKPAPGAIAKKRSSSPKLVLNAAVLAAFLVFVAVRVQTVLRGQSRLEAEHFPEAAVHYIQNHRPPAPILNHYNWGGYFIWKVYPEYRVFIDGRADLYGDRFMEQFLDVVYLSGNPPPTLDQWDIRTVVLPPESPLLALLRLNHSWTEAYADSVAVILVRK